MIRVSGPSPYAGCPAGAAGVDVNYLDAEVEPRLAIDPATRGTDHVHLVGLWQQDRWRNGGASGIVSASSLDGGHSWSVTPVPFTRCAPGGLGFDGASDPWVSIGPDGTVYIAAIGVGPNSQGSQPGNILTAVSRDGGRTWAHVQVIPGGDDKVSVTADPSRPGVAYVVWRPWAMFSRTTDGGRTWSPPRNLWPNGLNGPKGPDTVGDQILVDPRTDALYYIYNTEIHTPPDRVVCKQVKDRNHPKGQKQCREVLPARSVRYEQRVAFMTSKNEGTTWSKPNTIADARLAEWVEAPEGGYVRGGDTLPDAALDPETGRLYVVWEDARFSRGRYDKVALRSSGDGGRNWSAVTHVNVSQSERAMTPSIAVNQNGVVGVTYYTVPPTDNGQQSLLATYWFASSRDHGSHFGPAVRIAGPFDLTTAPITFPTVGSSRGPYFLGDYQGLAAGTAFYPFFVATNSGNLANRTDVFSTSIVP